MDLSHKSRFRLTLELYLCGYAMLIGMEFLPIGVIAVGVTALYIQRLSKELKGRREPMTPKQKNTLFAIQAAVCAIVVVGLLVLALWRETALAWIIFSLIAVLMLSSLYFGYRQIYRNEPTVW